MCIVSVRPRLIRLVAAAPLGLLGPPHFIVEASLVFLAENGVSIVDGLELCFSLCSFGIAEACRAVGVVLFGQCIERFLDVGVGGGLPDPEGFIIVFRRVNILDVFLLVVLEASEL